MLLSILIIITLNSLINCLLPFHLAFLLENSLVLSFEVLFFVFPFCLFFIFSTLFVTLMNDTAWGYNQQHGLSTTGWGRIIHVGIAIASSQSDAIQRGLLCLRKMASIVWGMTQHMDPDCCSPSSLPRATNPDSPQVSPVHSLHWSLGQVATNAILCVNSLRGSLSLQPSLSGKQKLSCFSQLDTIWVPSPLWCCRLGSPTLGLEPALLKGNPLILKHPSGPSAAAHGSLAGALLPPPQSLPVLLWWSSFFCLSLDIRFLSSSKRWYLNYPSHTMSTLNPYSLSHYLLKKYGHHQIKSNILWNHQNFRINVKRKSVSFID